MNFEKIKTLKLVIFALLCCPAVTVQSKQLLHIGTTKYPKGATMPNLGPLAYSVWAVGRGGSKILLHILYSEETCTLVRSYRISEVSGCLSEHYGAGELSQNQSFTRIVGQCSVFWGIRKLDDSKILHDIIEKVGRHNYVCLVGP